MSKLIKHKQCLDLQGVVKSSALDVDLGLGYLRPVVRDGEDDALLVMRPSY